MGSRSRAGVCPAGALSSEETAMKACARIVGVLALLAVCDAAMAAGTIGGGISSRSNRNNRKKDPRYMVVQCGDEFGTVTFEVISTESYRERQKECEEEFKELARDWVAGYREAKKNGEKYTEPKPKKPYVVRCKYAKSSYKTEEEAQKFADKITEAYERKMEARRKKAEGQDDEEVDDFGGDDDDGGDKKDDDDDGKEKKRKK
jgi:hypothetical protein